MSAARRPAQSASFASDATCIFWSLACREASHPSTKLADAGLAGAAASAATVAASSGRRGAKVLRVNAGVLACRWHGSSSSQSMVEAGTQLPRTPEDTLRHPVRLRAARALLALTQGR